MTFDWDTMMKVGGGLVAGFGTVIGVVRGTNVKIGVLDSELTRQRGHIVELFKENQKIREEMNSGFTTIRGEVHNMHIDIIERLPGK